MKGKKQTHPPAGKQKWTYSNSSWYPAFSNGLSSNTKEWQIVSNCFQKKDYDHKTQDISGSAPHVTGASTNENSTPEGSVKLREFISENSLLFMHSCGLALPFPKEKFRSPVFLTREISHRTTDRGTLTLLGTSPGQNYEEAKAQLWYLSFTLSLLSPPSWHLPSSSSHAYSAFQTVLFSEGSQLISVILQLHRV